MAREAGRRFPLVDLYKATSCVLMSVGRTSRMGFKMCSLNLTTQCRTYSTYGIYGTAILILNGMKDIEEIQKNKILTYVIYSSNTLLYSVQTHNELTHIDLEVITK